MGYFCPEETEPTRKWWDLLEGFRFVEFDGQLCTFEQDQDVRGQWVTVTRFVDPWTDEVLPDHFEEPHACDRCGTTYDEAQGDGYCGLCPSCADATEPKGDDDE